MLNLRSIYYYFLALKISSLKFCKKIYFKTNFYKKSLVSITPKQFYFYPNTFLLSSITNNENFSFNLSDIDPYTLTVSSETLLFPFMIKLFATSAFKEVIEKIEIIKMIKIFFISIN